MRRIFVAEFSRILLSYKRYPTEAIAQIFIAAGGFIALVKGGSFLSGIPLMGTRLSDLVISYILWMLILNSIGDSGFSVVDESEAGTLEQLYLSKYNPTQLFLIRSVVNIIFSLLFILIVMTLLMLVMGISLHVRFELIIMPIVLALIVAMGVGLLVASLAILFKKVTQLFTIIQFGFIFLIMYPFSDGNILSQIVGNIMPITPIYVWLTNITRSQSMFYPNRWQLLFSVVNALVWFTGGIICYQVASNRAQRLGTLGHY